MDTQFHILSFEGPDAYSFAGGLGTRVSGLSRTLAAMGFETHVWFVGDPDKNGHETQHGVELHRWCQWVSRHYLSGVYAGQDEKAIEYARSLPPHLVAHLAPLLRSGRRAVILAEEWQTVGAVLSLDQLLRQRGLRDRATILWNANNRFGFESIDWRSLSSAAAITTVSRYMKHLLENESVESIVIPNGLPPEAFGDVRKKDANEIRGRVAGRTLVTKMARFDPDKRWLSSIGIIAALKRDGFRPLLIARGSNEPHGDEVLRAAHESGLSVRETEAVGVRGILGSLSELENVDVLNVQSHIDWETRKLLFQESSTVLANSGHEPFGLVGLETMAVGGLACTGCTGEDYVIPGFNAMSVQTSNPEEFISQFVDLRHTPDDEQKVREAARITAARYAWSSVIQKSLLPTLRLGRRT